MNDALHLWMNIGVLLAIVGAATYFSCLGATSWWGDE